MAALPFIVDFSLQLPPEEGKELAPVTVRYSGSANSIVRYKLALTGSGTRTLDFGTIPSVGAKLILVMLTGGTDPLLVYVNGSATFEEITVGGAKIVLSPNPVNGTTSLVLEHTTDSLVQVWLLG